jgi:hypothetical protein
MDNAMVTYPYEDLGPERFQELCQALLVQQFPRAQCMPIGMPDGGRDAVVSRRTTDTLVFQVKYRRKTPLADATYPDFLTWLQDTVTSELPSILRLVGKGVSHYILMTNVPCSPHTGGGTRDKMRVWLAKQIPANVEIDVFWRDDLDRRVDSNWELKRTYALTSSTASADSLLVGMTGEQTTSGTRFLTIRKFIKGQYDRDASIRFREADLPNQPLLANYLDIGAQPHLNASEQQRFTASRRNLRYTPVDVTRHNNNYGYFRQNTGASLLLQLAGTQDLIRTVIEGAPGQGKSTLVQYVCQVHRARILGKDVRPAPVEYRTCPILLPFRTDLRDLATWLLNENPFGEDKSVESYPRSVEGFLAAMVHIVAGGGSFTVDDLDTIIAKTPVLLAFDGLDEVADIEMRTRIVNELVDCSSRLQEIGREVRFVVTSRPSAFSAAPRFPADRFSYITLTNLSLPLIMEYTKTWMKTRKVEADESRELTRTLSEKLREPHIAELARNSMQLAILLWLIYQQKGNLPEQRTSLYGQYITTFLTREAAKSKIIRELGGTILQLHGYLAWVLHARAESGRAQGNIAETELKSLLRQYLHDKGYSQLDLVDELFQGMAERFIALVSRVQGTWEFEVQPLREYFAAYHLHDTARMSRAGKEVTGTKADRFDAIAGNPYWLNVTRFYVGFFDKGELAYLLHQFRATFAEGRYCTQTYSRSLANSIISDQVFIQSPAMGRELSELIAKDVIGWFALSRGDGMGVLRIPMESGGAEVVEQAKEILVHGEINYSSPVVQVLADLADREKLVNWWHKNLPARSSERWLRWMLIGVGLNALQELSNKELLQIFSKKECDVLDHGLLYRGEATRVGVESPGCGSKMLDYLKAGIYQPPKFMAKLTVLDLSGLLFFEGSFEIIADQQFATMLKHAEGAEHLSALTKLLAELSREGRRRRRLWHMDVSKSIEEYFGPCWLATRFSVLRFFLSGDGRSADNENSDLLDVKRPLLERFGVAVGRRSDVRWWEECIGDCPTPDDAQLLLTALMCIADENVISRCLPLLSDVVDSWTPEQIIGTLETITVASTRQNRLNARQISTSEINSPVLLAAVANRSRVDQRQRFLSAAIAGSSDERVRLALAENLIDGCVSRIAHTGRWVGTREMVLKHGSMLEAERYSMPLRRRERSERVMDDTVASEVLAKPELYPVDVVIMADQSASQRASISVPLVSVVAVQDVWFDEDQPF